MTTKNIQQLLLDKLFVCETLNQNHAIFFNDEIKKILIYIEELETKLMNK